MVLHTLQQSVSQSPLHESLTRSSAFHPANTSVTRQIQSHVMPRNNKYVLNLLHIDRFADWRSFICSLACMYPLGLEVRYILDEQMSASSVLPYKRIWFMSWAAQEARLRNRGWCVCTMRWHARSCSMALLSSELPLNSAPHNLCHVGAWWWHIAVAVRKIHQPSCFCFFCHYYRRRKVMQIILFVAWLRQRTVV